MAKLTLFYVPLLGVALLAVGGCSHATSTTTTITITNPFLHDADVDAAYSDTLIASGGSAIYPNWSIITGALPDGLSLNSSNGIISGIPRTAGIYSFTVKATDSNGETGTQDLSINVDEAPSISTTSLPDGAANNAYSQALEVSGGDGIYTWYIMSGALPVGLTLDLSTGMISGTPTTTGPSSFVVQLTDSNGVTATQPLLITIESAFSIDNKSLPAGIVNANYLQTLAASGGSGTYTNWSVTTGTLPDGLSLDLSSGIISGTPTTAGLSGFTVQATDSNGATATQYLTIDIAAAATSTTS